MIRQLAFAFLFLFPHLTFAQLDSQFVFNGQNAEVLNAEKVVTVTVPEQVQVPDTCSRQVPTGSIRVCRDETRYREECTWIPSSEDCGYESERVCSPVSRSREVCSGGGSHQECTDIPSRTVCVERPTREVCNTNPHNGQETCRTVGGGETCNEVGGGQSCRTVNEPQSCHTEYYSDEECSNESRYRCETIPGRNDCSSIPYSEEVCGMEMQYRTESYACTRTETVNRFVQKNVKAETHVEVITNGLVEEFPMSVSIKETSALFKAFTISVQLTKQPKIFVALKKKEITITSETAKEIVVKATLVLEMMTQEMIPVQMPTAITSATLDKYYKTLVIAFAGPLSAKGKVDLIIKHKALFGTKTDAEFQGEFPSQKITVKNSSLHINLQDAFAKKPVKGMKMDLTLDSEMTFKGEILNIKKPQAQKSFQKIEVILN